MTQVTFFVLSEHHASEGDMPSHMVVAAEEVSKAYSNKHKCFVLTENKSDAERFDEHLWNFNPERFVAHNLKGEGPKWGSPVEITWELTQSNRPLLVNLGNKAPENASRFKQIFDFVPFEESLREQARERYRQYRIMGCQLHTENL